MKVLRVVQEKYVFPFEKASIIDDFPMRELQSDKFVFEQRKYKGEWYYRDRNKLTRNLESKEVKYENV